MTPDRLIVKKVKRYDRNLYIRWNMRGPYFELWMKRLFKPDVLITPITQSIYDGARKKEFVQLDERLLWWIYDADSWRWGGPNKFALEADSRWQEFQQRLAKNRKQGFRDIAKDLWQDTNSFYTTKRSIKNKATFETKRDVHKMSVLPDRQLKTSSRLFSRSAQNAKRHGYRP